MNRFINALLLFLFLPTLLLCIYIGFDLPIRIVKTSGANLPYRQEILLGLGLLLFVVVLRRSLRRWMGMRIVSRTEKFRWNVPVSVERKKRVNTYTILESLVLTCAGASLYILTPEAWFPAGALILSAADGIVFMLIASTKNAYRVALSSKALMVADREVVLLYFTGLRKVSIHQQTIYFDYIKDLQLSFPSDCIPEDQREEFFTQLEAQFDPDRVYVARNW